MSIGKFWVMNETPKISGGEQITEPQTNDFLFLPEVSLSSPTSPYSKVTPQQPFVKHSKHFVTVQRVSCFLDE